MHSKQLLFNESCVLACSVAMDSLTYPAPCARVVTSSSLQELSCMQTEVLVGASSELSDRTRGLRSLLLHDTILLALCDGGSSIRRNVDALLMSPLAYVISSMPLVFRFLLGSRVIGAGPLLPIDKEADDPTATPVGSLVFFNSRNDELAKEFAERDPYSAVGLFDNVFVARYVGALGAPVSIG